MYLDEDINEPAPLELTDQEVFTWIWTSPRTVFRFIHETYYNKYGNALLALGGIVRALDRAFSSHMGDDMSLWGVLLFCVILGGSLGWISYYLFAALIAWTGRWLNGNGDTKDIFRVMTYAIIPTIVTLLLLVIQIILLGEGMFQSSTELSELDTTTKILFAATGFLEILFGLWTFFLLVVGVAEVQKFSYGKAFFNTILPILVIGLPLMLMFYLLK